MHAQHLHLLKDAIQKRAFIRDSVEKPVVSSDEHSYSPWLFDFREIMLDAEILDAYAEIFWERFGSHYPFQVGGLESAAIPLVSAILMKSAQRKKPVNGFYIRKSRKRMGLVKLIEGKLSSHPIILVDDLINSGASLDKQMKILDDAGARVSDIFVMLSFRSREAYAELEKHAKITSLFSLSDFGLPLQDEHKKALREFKEVWRFHPEKPSLHLVVQKSAPVVDDVRIYFGCDDGKFRALQQDSGRVAWEFSVKKHPRGKAILSSPALHDGVVYFGAYDGNVYALDASSGQKLWQYDDADWIGSSPALAPKLGLVFIGLEFGLFRKRGGIAALSLKDGSCAWNTYMPEHTHGSPIYIAEKNLVVIGSNDGLLYGYDAMTGEPRFSFTTAGGIKSAPAYDAKHDLILFGSMDGNCYAIRSDGTPAFALQTGAGIYSTPLVLNDRAYVASLDKTLYAIDLNSGKQTGSFETAGRIFSSPVIFENSIWLGSNDGKLYELSPETLALRGEFQASERIVNKIAYNEKTKKFFVPTVANEIYCLERQ